MEALNLSNGAENALYRAGFGSLGDFHELTKADLLIFKHIGKKRAREIALVLEDFLEDLPTPESLDSSQEEDVPEPAPDWFYEVSISELPSDVCPPRRLAKNGIRSLADLFLITSADDLRSIPRIGAKAEASVRRYLGDLAAIGLEALRPLVREDSDSVLPSVGMEIVKELLRSNSIGKEIQSLAANLSERNAQLFLARICYGESSQPTLEELGKAVGITRERVRQITRRQEKFLEESNLRLPLSSAVVNALEEEGGLRSTDELLETAHANGIRIEPDDVYALPFLSELGLVPFVTYFRSKASWVTDTGKRRWIDSGLLEDVFARLRRTALQSYREISCVSREILESLSSLDSTQLQRAVSEKGHELISVHGFLILDPPRESTLTREVRKMLVVAGDLPLRSARGGLARHRSIETVPPPSVLRRILELHSDFGIHEDSILPVSELTRQEILSDSEQALLTLFERNEGVMDYYEIVDGIVAAGFSKPTATVLMRSTFLTRPATGVYTLRGVPIRSERVEQAITARRESRGPNKLSADWLDPTAFEVTYQVSRHNLSGVLAIPSNFNSAIEEWEGILPDGSTSQLTLRNNLLWSLRDWFQDVVSEGDVVVATFFPGEARIEFEYVEQGG